MANSYSRIYIHFVAVVKYRQALIAPSFEGNLYGYIRGIAKNLDQYVEEINGMPDHIHILAHLRPTMAPSTFIQKVKANSSKWINENRFHNQRFQWQRGSGMFSVDYHGVDKVAAYIRNQKIHHKNKNHKEEYLDILKNYDIKFEHQYLPEFFD